MTEERKVTLESMPSPTKERVSAASHLVPEIGSYSDDASSSIEAPMMLDDEQDILEDPNTNDQDDEGNDHAVETGPPKIIQTQERRAPNASRVADRLKQAEALYNPNMYRSSDLLPLQREYGSMKRSLLSLLDGAKAYCEATEELCEAQSQFIHNFEGLADKSPLQSFVMRDHGSLVEVQKQATMYHGYNIAEYQQQILAYIENWITSVSSQLDDQLENIPKLRAILQENEAKMEKLLNKQRAHPETFDQDLTEPLEVSQQKLRETRQEHEEACSKACYMIEQVVRKGWKDLYPLMSKMMKWELNQLGRDNKSFGQFLPETLKKLSQTTIATLEVDLLKKNEIERAISGPQSFYGSAAVVEDYLTYFPPDLPHLFISPVCPYSQMAWIAFLEKERNAYDPRIFQMHYVCNFLKYKDPGFKLLSKLGIVDSAPVLLHKGNVFHECTSLLEYIDACFPESSQAQPPNGKSGNGTFRKNQQPHASTNSGHKRLTPTNPIEVFNMSLFLDKYSDLPKLYQTVLEHNDKSTPAASSIAGEELLERLEMLDKDLQQFPGPFLCGYSFTLADIFVIPFVERIQVVLKHYRQLEIPSSLTKLHSWYKIVTARSSVKISMADRTKASLYTCAMSSVGRNDYLIEYNEAAAKGELALAHRLFAAQGAPGQNPYHRIHSVAQVLGDTQEDDEYTADDDRELVA